MFNDLHQFIYHCLIPSDPCYPSFFCYTLHGERIKVSEGSNSILYPIIILDINPPILPHNYPTQIIRRGGRGPLYKICGTTFKNSFGTIFRILQV